MKLFVHAMIVLLVSYSICSAREPQATDQSNKPALKRTGFLWLKQFEGTWTVTSRTPDADPQADSGQSTKMTSRAIGGRWIVNEQVGQMGAMRYQAIQTIGFDKSKNRFTGNWIDSMQDYKWSYDGSLDESGKQLLLETEGPDWRGSTKIIPYRDVFEVVSENEFAHRAEYKNSEGEWEAFLVSTITRNMEDQDATKTTAVATTPSSSPVTPFLMFQGKGVQAIEFYKTVFDDLKIESMSKHGAEGPGKEGTIQVATIVIAGQRVMCIDSPTPHDFSFTPSFSFFVECETQEQLKERFAKLSEGGTVRMPIDNYGFSKQFGWVTDQFGVSWQLNLN
jgi:predicted 3-demethylubiquinone-9 3-methyltransferase (glyoxalase superfamily)